MRTQVQELLEWIDLTDSTSAISARRLTIANSSERPAVYKIKTTSPDKYKVRPSMYCLGAGSTNVVEIAAQSTTAAALVRDKFLITAVAVEQEGVPATKIAEIMKVCEAATTWAEIHGNRVCI